MKIAILFLLFILCSCNKDVESKSKTPSIIEDVAELVNERRISLGLAPLIYSEDLGSIATGHSLNMAKGLVSFGHDGFASRCTSARAALSGGNWCAENVAQGQKTADEVFNSWINSSAHKANIEKATATHLGIGVAQSSSGSWYWTQIFIEL